MPITTLGSNDEYFIYGFSDILTQGRWWIYGLHLPDDVLEKIYSLNARHVLLHEGNRSAC